MMNTQESPQIKVGYGNADLSIEHPGRHAAASALTGIAPKDISVVLVFASVHCDLPRVLSEVKEVVGETPILGATTAGEICNDTCDDTIVVLILASPFLKVQIGLGCNVSKDWKNALEQAINVDGIQDYFGPSSNQMWQQLMQNGESAFAMLFWPGTTRTNLPRGLEILEDLKARCSNRLPVFGAGAADSWEMDANYVFFNGCVYPDSLVLAIFRTHLPFGISITHGFHPTDTQATITKADHQEILELDNRPAAEVFGEFLNIPEEQLPGTHLSLSTGKVFGLSDSLGEYSLVIANYVSPRNGVRVSRPVTEGSRLQLMQGDENEILDAGRVAAVRCMLRSGISEPALILVCSCALRKRLLNESYSEEIHSIRKLLPNTPIIGFYSFGEQGPNIEGMNSHNNDAIVVMALGKELSFASQVSKENERLRRELETSVRRLYETQKDIEERERKYRELYSMMRLICDNVPDLIWAKDPENKYIFVNQAHGSLFLKTKDTDEPIGHTDHYFEDLILEGLEPPARPTFADKCKVSDDRILLRKKPERFDESGVIDGDHIDLDVYKGPLWGLDGELLGTVGCGRIVTQERKAQQALQESQQRLDLALTGGGLGMWDWNIQSGEFVFSDMVYSMFEYAPGEIEASFSEYKDHLHPDERDVVLKRILDHFDGRTNIFESENRIRTRTGKWKWVVSRGSILERDESGNPIRALGTVMDVTERRAAQEMVRKQMEFLDSVLAAMTNPLYVVDVASSRIFKSNPAAVKRGIYEGTTCFESLHGRSTHCADDKCPVKLVQSTGKPVSIEHIHKGDGGEYRFFEIYAYPVFDKNNTVEKVICYSFDITDRRRARELQLFSERCKAVTDLSAGVAHNFNNILQIIIGNATVGLMNLESQEYNQLEGYLNQIVQSSKLGAETVRRLNTFARFSQSFGLESAEIFDLSKLVDEACEISIPWWKLIPESKGKTIILEKDLSEGCFIRGKQPDLFEVVINLIKNASEALLQGGTIEILCKVEQDQVLLHIRDDGIGIPEANLDKIFIPFFTTKFAAGTGLGLAMCRTIIHNHGGQIFASSIEGQGTVFTVKLPYETMDQVHIPEMALKRSRPANVLVIDDIPAFNEMMQDGLQLYGHKVVCVETGLQALEKFKEILFDIVICDFGLPDINGFEVCRRLYAVCEQEKRRKPGFIILTGWGVYDLQSSELPRAGINAVLEKPVQIDKLVEVIDQVLKDSAIQVN